MSIAEKLIKIAENEPKVFEAGKVGAIQNIEPATIDTSVFQEKLQTIANNTLAVYEAGRSFAERLKCTASGTVIFVDNVSPIEHELSIQLTIEDLADYSTVDVYVSRYGKNLLSSNYYSNSLTSYGISYTDNKDGTITVNGANDGTGHARFILFYGNKKLPIGTYVGSSNNDDCYMVVCVKRSSGTTQYFANGISFTINEGDSIQQVYIQVLQSTATVFNNVIIKPILQVGTVVTEYEPYIEPQTAKMSGDGTVKGLTSVSPNMTVFADTDGAFIELEYYGTE
jgi:hypothetical protein